VRGPGRKNSRWARSSKNKEKARRLPSKNENYQGEGKSWWGSGIKGVTRTLPERKKKDSTKQEENSVALMRGDYLEIEIPLLLTKTIKKTKE